MYLLKASVAIRHDFLLTNADYLKAKKNVRVTLCQKPHPLVVTYFVNGHFEALSLNVVSPN